MIAIINGCVVPMADERVLPEHTVFVREGRIVAVVPTTGFVVPPAVEVVDAGGGYVVPGLADMHVHLESEVDLSLFLSAGVTTVRNMRGEPSHLAWRKAIEQNERRGPTIITCGPILDGKPPTALGAVVIETAEDAEAAVGGQKEAGYDFIKIYDGLSLPAYEAIMAAARRNGMPVTGHISRAVRLRRTLFSGQSCIEHLSGYVDSIETADSLYRGKWNWRKTWHAVEVDGGRIARAAAATREAGVWNCPTLTVYQNLAARSKSASMEEAMRQGEAVRMQLLKALSDAGAGLLIGSDASNGGLAPGETVHNELRNFVLAGLTPYQALCAATRDAAIFLGKKGDFGTIEPGKRADLLLVRGNPLEDLKRLEHPERIMVRGEWCL